MLSGAVVGVRPVSGGLRLPGARDGLPGPVTARVSLKTLPDEKVLWENPAFTFRDNYQFNATAATYVDRENDAIDRVADRFAQSLVTSMLEGF